jgi:hypothetical protein
MTRETVFGCIGHISLLDNVIEEQQKIAAGWKPQKKGLPWQMIFELRG